MTVITVIYDAIDSKSVFNLREKILFIYTEV